MACELAASSILEVPACLGINQRGFGSPDSWQSQSANDSSIGFVAQNS